MNLKLGGIVWPGETPGLLGPYFLLHNVFTPWSAGGIQLSITLPQVPANTFTTFKLATVTANHASVSRVSRCCGLLFSEAAAVNLSSESGKAGENGLEDDHGSPPPICWLSLSLYTVGLCGSGGTRRLHKDKFSALYVL